jgi:hypothetical protein
MHGLSRRGSLAGGMLLGRYDVSELLGELAASWLGMGFGGVFSKAMSPFIWTKIKSTQRTGEAVRCSGFWAGELLSEG